MALHKDGALDQAPGEALAWLQDFISVDTINPLLPGSDPISLLIGSDPFSRPLFTHQSVFASTFRLSLDTLTGWEQGKRKPDAAAANFLRLIKADPDYVQRTLAA